MKLSISKLKDYIIIGLVVLVFIYYICFSDALSKEVNDKIAIVLAIFCVIIFLNAIYEDIKEIKYKTKSIILLIDILVLSLVVSIIFIAFTKGIKDYLDLLIVILVLNGSSFLRSYLKKDKFLKEK